MMHPEKDASATTDGYFSGHVGRWQDPWKKKAVDERPPGL